MPFRPRLTRKTTTVEPFTFDERDRLMFEKKEQKINEIIAEENKVLVLNCLFQHASFVTLCIFCKRLKLY